MRRELAAKRVHYLVLPDAGNPWLLARVRWPDVFEAISPARPYWQSDPGLFDLPYDGSGVPVTAARAEELATEWGAALPGESEGSVGPSFIRRMPANWSKLTPAERRAWSIGPEQRARARGWRRRRGGVGTTVNPAVLTDTGLERVIDLTDGALAEATSHKEPERVIDLTDGAVAEATSHKGPERVIDLTGGLFEDVTWTEKA